MRRTGSFYKSGPRELTFWFELGTLVKSICGYGGIGRRAGFRFLCRKACGFDPHYPHPKTALFGPVLRNCRRGLFVFRRPFLGFEHLFHRAECKPLILVPLDDVRQRLSGGAGRGGIVHQNDALGLLDGISHKIAIDGVGAGLAAHSVLGPLGLQPQPLMPAP